MKSWPMIALTLSVLAASQVLAADAVSLRYGFKQGATYSVRQLHHDVGKSIVDMSGYAQQMQQMMGQQMPGMAGGKMESPIDRLYKSAWSARVVGKKNGAIRLAMDYGQQEGGERWAGPSGDSAQHFGDSRGEALIDPRKGVVGLSTEPAEGMVELIYRARLAWLPVLPQGRLKLGDSFSHDYVFKDEMYSMKSEDEYILDEVSDGYAYFSVESRALMVIRSTAPQQAQGMSGMGGEMRIAYRGDGSAVFSLKEGIFIEREMKLAYDTPESGSGGFNTTMRGAVRERFEMERR